MSQNAIPSTPGTVPGIEQPVDASPGQGKSSRLKDKILRLSALAGILILAFLIYKIGPAEIWQNIKKISPVNFLILLGLRTLYWVLRTICWQVILDKYTGNAPLFHLFMVRLCGHAVSQLTPTAQVGSEATRMMMVKCTDRKVSVASVIVDKTIECLVAAFFIMFGIILLLFRISLSGRLKIFFIASAIISVLLMLFVLFKQKKGILGWLVDLLAKIRIRPKFIERNREKIKETDSFISDFYQHHRGAFIGIFFLYALLMMLWVVEVHLNLVYIGIDDISFTESFLVTTIGNLALIFPFIPGSLGLYEVTYIGLFAMLGRKADIGFTLVLFRRLTSLVLAGLGLLFMFTSGSRRQNTPD